MAYTAEIFTSTIVALGNFNPAIFSPDWLEQSGLIGADDAAGIREGADGNQLVLSRQVTTCESTWFSLQVLQDRFTVASKGVLSPAFKDLVVGILQLVPQTPITAVGLNFLAHFKLPSKEQYFQVGDVLAPKDIWRDLFPDEMPGLGELTIRVQQGTREDPAPTRDEKRISIQQSNLIKLGIVLSYNDHHDVTVPTDPILRPAERVADIIDSDWESAWKDAVRVFDGVLTAAQGT
ncbi:MAG: hypothetical protein WBN02_08525 [Sedimenticolaceae bacterium]